MGSRRSGGVFAQAPLSSAAGFATKTARRDRTSLRAFKIQNYPFSSIMITIMEGGRVVVFPSHCCFKQLVVWLTMLGKPMEGWVGQQF